MKKKRFLSILLAGACLVSLLAGCGSKTADAPTAGESRSDDPKAHEPITMLSAFPGTGRFVEVVKEKYPEINLEIIPYSGNNMTAYVKDQLAVGEMPDIYVTTVYSPGQLDLSDRLIDLSGYSFTNNYSENQLRAASDGGKLYLLPTYYTCMGITYNKTLLERNGWTLPKTFAQLEALAPEVQAAGCQLAIDQITLPGYGFQYFCNIMDTDFLNTLAGRKWQNDFLSGDTTVASSPEMMDALSTLEKWRRIGMLNGDTDLTGAGQVRAIMGQGNTLFMLGSSNNYADGDSEYEFGFMPYLSADGTQNALILNVSRYVGLNKQLEDKGSEQKLEDALHVLEVLSTVEGMGAACYGMENTALMPLKDYVIPEDSYYKQVEDELNAGLTAPFIYAGWDNLIVPIGDTMIDYIQGKAELEDVIAAFDDNQHLLWDNTPATFTQVTENLDTRDCARLVGICFAKAAKADLALVSENRWYEEAVGYSNLDTDGVSGGLMPMAVSDQEITTILPTGWRGNIQTVTLTGARIRELLETGYVKSGMTFPYELVTPEGMTLEDDTVYTAVICGMTDDVAEEGNLTDTGVLGLEAMKEYLSGFETLSKQDIRWE